ncbi:MAG: hypothetical protein ACMUJM_02190 [bacterium]
MKGNTEPMPVTLTGIIIVVDWDENNNIVDIALATAYEQDYRINNTHKKTELLGLIGREVKVIGTVKADEHGKKIINVQKYEPLEFD